MNAAIAGRAAAATEVVTAAGQTPSHQRHALGTTVAARRAMREVGGYVGDARASGWWWRCVFFDRGASSTSRLQVTLYFRILRFFVQCRTELKVFKCRGLQGRLVQK